MKRRPEVTPLSVGNRNKPRFFKKTDKTSQGLNTNINNDNYKYIKNVENPIRNGRDYKCN